jgi:DNA modification methylase
VKPLTAKTAHKPRPIAKPSIHRIIEGDCLDLMAKIPDRSIDFICADFPYNISGK